MTVQHLKSKFLVMYEGMAECIRSHPLRLKVEIDSTDFGESEDDRFQNDR